jgi:AraC-like DNA-binding protein
MLTWGLSEILPARDLADRTVTRRLLTRACFGPFGRMILDELATRVDSGVRPDLIRLIHAVLSALAEGEPKPAAVARRLHMSRSSLDRFAWRTGLVAPSGLVQRTRLILAVLLRSVPARRTTAWRELGFYSQGDLSGRLRRHFGVGLREVDRMDTTHWLRMSVDALLRAPMTGLGDS